MNKIRLKGITWNHPRGYSPLIASSELFKSTTQIEVVWDKRPLKNFGDKSLYELTNQYDLLIIDHPYIGIAAQTGYLFALDDLIEASTLYELKNQSVGPSYDSYCYMNKQWALPVDSAAQCAVSRPDLLNEKIPGNWDEVFQLSDKIKYNSKKLGMALCPADSLCTFLSLTAQLGSPIKDGQHQFIDEDVCITALDIMRRMRDNFHEQSLKWDPIQLLDHMSTYDDIIYAPLVFSYTNYSRKGFKSRHLRFYNAPGVEYALLGGAGIAISSNTKYPNECAKFVTWITSSTIQKSVYVKENGQPGNIEAWKDKNANLITNNFFKNTIKTMELAYVRPRNPSWPTFQEFLGNTIHQNLAENTNPKLVTNLLRDTYIDLFK